MYALVTQEDYIIICFRSSTVKGKINPQMQFESSAQQDLEIKTQEMLKQSGCSRTVHVQRFHYMAHHNLCNLITKQTLTCSTEACI